jgi:hypothetical protein
MEYPSDLNSSIREQAQPAVVSDQVAKRLSQMGEEEAQKQQAAEAAKKAATDRYISALNGEKTAIKDLDQIIAILGLTEEQVDRDQELIRLYHRCVEDSRANPESLIEQKRLRARITEFEEYAKDQLRQMRKMKGGLESRRGQGMERLRDLRRAAAASPLFNGSNFDCHGFSIPALRGTAPTVPAPIGSDYSTSLLFEVSGAHAEPIFIDFEIEDLSFVRAIGQFSGAVVSLERKTEKGYTPCGHYHSRKSAAFCFCIDPRGESTGYRLAIRGATEETQIQFFLDQ